MCRFWKVLGLTIILALSPTTQMLGQNPSFDGTSVTPTTGVGHDYIQALNETVNPADGSVSVRIAAPTPQERGLNFPLYAYIYDTNGQIQLYPTYTSGGSSPYPQLLHEVEFYGSGINSTGGSTLTGAPSDQDNIKSFTLQAPGTLSKQHISLESGDSHTCEYTTGYVYTDNAGGRHPLGSMMYMAAAYQNAASCGYFGVSEEVISTGGDGTVFGILDPNSISGDAYVYDLHGNQLNPDYKIEDTNGNYLNGTGRPYAGSYSGGSVPTSLTIPGLGSAYTYSYPSISGQQLSFSLNPVGNSSNYSECPTTFTNGTAAYTGNTVIALPESGQTYTITFDPTYGLIKQIMYPTGATVTYTWENNAQSHSATFLQGNSDSCAYTFDWPAILSRVVSYDGVHNALEQNFTYTTALSGAYGWTSKTTTVTTTDLLTSGTPSFKTLYSYLPTSNCTLMGSGTLGNCAPVENTIQYQDTSGNVLQTVTKTWNALNQLLGECTTLPNGHTGGKFYQYANSLAILVTDEADYDYGTITTPCQRPSSTPTRETATQYQSFANTPIVPGASSIQNRPSSVTVYGNGTQLSQATYLYDKNSITPVSPAAIAHDETNYSASATSSRGNLTSVTRVCSPSCASPVVSYSYDETGQLVSTTDANSNPKTTYSYLDTYAPSDGSAPGNTNTYLTKITGPVTNGTSHIQTFSYGYDDGKVRSSTDVGNSAMTQYCYFIGGCSGSTMDSWARLTGIENPDTGNTTESFSDAGPNPYSTVSTALNSGTSETTKTILDAYGHVIHSELTTDPGGADYVDTVYNGFGQVYTISDSYRSTSEPTYGLTKYAYDSLNRPTKLTHPDSFSESWSYSSNQVTFTDENGNIWLRTSDGLGRLTSVLEPNGASTASSMETDYSYDANNNLLLVTQWGGASGSTSPRKRYFNYDSLSRLICSSNPENSTAACPTPGTGTYTAGTTGYTYDANSNLYSKTDARGVASSFQYDALNRLISKTYPGDTSGTPISCFQYDTSSVSGASGNLIGRLTNAWTQSHSSGSCGSGPTTSNYLALKSVLAYDPMGRPTSAQQQQCVGTTCSAPTPYSLGMAYDLAGNLTTLTNSVGAAGQQLTLNNYFDAASRPCLTTATTGNTSWSGIYPENLFQANPSSTTPGYAAFGGLQNWYMGSPSATALTACSSLPSPVSPINITQGYTNRLWVNSISATGQIP
jgi:YD repeat-containing protein